MKIIFVCTGNVCRSPLAEGYLKTLLNKRGMEEVEVSSAGVAALSGAPPFDCAIDVARQHNFDISEHRAQQINAAMARDADKILCMETWQAGTILDMDPQSQMKIALLGGFHPDGKGLFQIPDPRDFDVPETLKTFQLIKSSVEGFLESLV